MVCVLDFHEVILRVKQTKYERLDGSKFASHQAGAVDRFCHMSYQRFVVIPRTRSEGMGFDLTAADINIIFDNDWNPQLTTTIYPSVRSCGIRFWRLLASLGS